MPEPVDVREVMRQIQKRVNQRSLWHRTSVSSQPQLPAIGELKTSVDRLRIRQDLIDALPPSPSTLRGRIGALLVKVVRRGLFWHTARLRDFHSALIESFEAQTRAARALSEAVAEQRISLEELRGQVRDISARLADIESALSTAPGNRAEPDRPAGAS